MLINELSKRSGVSTHTLRYYENLGLIHGVTDETVKSNNYKQYDESLIEKLELIKEAKEVGFSLSEIKKMLDSWYSGTLSIEDQVNIVEAKIKEVDAKIDQLKGVKKLLNEVKKDILKGNC